MQSRIVCSLSAAIAAFTFSTAGAQVLPHAEWETVHAALPHATLAVPLSEGRALLTGAFVLGDDGWEPAAYLYEPWAGARRVADPPFLLDRHFGAPLGGGRALIGGGIGDSLSRTDECWVYDADTDEWSAVAPLPVPTANFYTNIAAALPDGRVFVAGGSTPEDVYYTNPDPEDHWTLQFGGRNVFIFDPRGETRAPDGTVLPGRWEERAKMPATARYRTHAPFFGRKTIPLPADRHNIEVGRVTHETAVLPDGRVLLIGGREFEPGPYYGIAKVDLYDPETDVWTRLADMPAIPHDRDAGYGGRGFPGVAVRPDGKVLVFGGLTTRLIKGGAAHEGVVFAISQPLRWMHRRSALLLDPDANAWRQVGDLNVARAGPAVASWPSDERTYVIAIGGEELFGPDVVPAEVYDPETETWSLLPPEPSATFDSPLRHGVGLTDGTVLTWSPREEDDGLSTLKRLHPSGLPSE